MAYGPCGHRDLLERLLGHDLEPNRFYAEMTRTAGELRRIGAHLVDLKKTNEVAILHSVDSLNAFPGRWTPAPGPLRKAAGFIYREFSTLEHPLQLRGDPFGVGTENRVMHWAEFLEPETAEPLAVYDHPFFGRWPAITRNRHGTGTLTYVGTWPSPRLLRSIVSSVLARAGCAIPDTDLPGPIRAKHGINRFGNRLHFYLNYSAEEHHVPFPHAASLNILSGESISPGDVFFLEPWGAAAFEES